MLTIFSHNKSMGIFSEAQGQLTPHSLIGSCWIYNPSEILWLYLLPARMKKNQFKMEELENSKDFPIITLWELSVAMETRVLIRSGPKPYAAFPPPNDAPDEIWFQSSCWSQRYSCFKVWTHAQMGGQLLESHPISSPGAEELKMSIKLESVDFRWKSNV